MNESIAPEADIILPKDILWGVPAIAAVINRTERQTYYLLAQKQLPAKRVGSQWMATRSNLMTWLNEQLANAG